MKRSPLLLSRMPPSPRTPSVISTPAPATPGRMELPELHVLQRNAGARRHAQAVAGVDERVGRRRKDAAGAAGGEQRRLRLQDHHLAGFHLQRGDAEHVAVGVADQVERHPFDEELRARPHVALVERVQHRVAGAVGRRARRAAPVSRRSSPNARRTAAGRSCRRRCGRTACRSARARRRLAAPSCTCTRSRPGRRASRSP